MKKMFLTAIALALVFAPAARAQGASVLGAGTRVKLIVPALDPAEQVGKIVSASRDSILFRADAYPVTRALAVSDVSSIEISGGQATHRGRDALYGLAIGGGAGALAGDASYRKPDNCFFWCDTRSSDAIAGAILGGLMGTLVGAFIVGSIDKTERWIPLRQPRLSIRPTAGSFRFALSADF